MVVNNFYEIISNSLHMFTIPVNIFLKSAGDQKNVNISLSVSLLEKQN